MERQNVIVPPEPAPFPPAKIWILGAGRFGRLAAQRLKKRLPESEILVVDRREDRIGEISAATGISGVVDDALGFLCANGTPDETWIVPAVPVHVAFEFALSELKMSGDAIRLHVPEAVDSQAPNPQRVPSGTVYTSFATFICPDFCSEPEEICTFTGKGRLGVLFDLLGKLHVPGHSVATIRSFQLAPGVGGYPGSSLKELVSRITRKPGDYTIATACRCHGVIDALRNRGRTSAF